MAVGSVGLPVALHTITKPSYTLPGSKVHGANMGSIWDRQDPGGPHVGSMNFAIWVLWLGFPTGHQGSLHTQVIQYSPLKTMSCRDANFAVAGGIGGFRYDNERKWYHAEKA